VLPWQKQQSTRRRPFSHQKSNVRKTSKILKWITDLYGAGNWTRRKAYQKYLESFEM
jgi:hypothetical protein